MPDFFFLFLYGYLRTVIYVISFPGGYGGEATPVPISNTVVKLSSADGTWDASPWESRPLPGIIFRSRKCDSYFLSYLIIKRSRRQVKKPYLSLTRSILLIKGAAATQRKNTVATVCTISKGRPRA